MKITRTFDILTHYQNHYLKEDALAAKKDGKWVKYSTLDYIENANYFSYGLLALGLKKDDKIVTVSNNRPEWNIADMGMSQIGVIHVPIYPTITSEEYEYILEHSDARIIIISDKILYQKIKPIADKIKHIEKVFTFNQVEDTPNWLEILNLGRKSEIYYKPELEIIKNKIKPEDIVSIIYTSGTTGISKGVMLTHNNFVSNLLAGEKVLPINHEHKVLSFLPLCHVYERLLNYMYQYRGIGIYYAENLGTIVDNLKEIKADGFTTVPRLLEKVYSTIMAKGKELKGVKKIIFDWAISLGRKYNHEHSNGFLYEMQLRLANKLVFNKWREALGGEIKFVGCGGAALRPDLEQMFWAAGISIQQGYGLTETSPLIAINTKNTSDKMIGSVGCVVENVQVKIAEDGEILCKGPNVMKGYYKNPQLTAEVISKDGWFRTGDIGTFVDGKFLVITDRKKEIFKTSSGKYIAPQVIESLFKQSQFIEQLMVVGENQKFPSALIAPNFPILQTWCIQNQIEYKGKNEIITNPKVIKLFQDEVKRLNKNLGKVEEIKKFKLISDEWSQISGELSPTLKLKRKVIIQKYASLVTEIYANTTNN